MGAICCKPKDDPKTQKSLENRSCTDILCLLFFVIICGGIMGMGIWALMTGDIDGSEPLARTPRPTPSANSLPSARLRSRQSSTQPTTTESTAASRAPHSKSIRTLTSRSLTRTSPIRLWC